MAAMNQVQSALKDDSMADGSIFPMVCDQTCLDSVHKFCEDLRYRLQSLSFPQDSNNESRSGIDVLCLNAAILLGEDAGPNFTKDGIELTFQTNHLAPFLIANLTYDLINPGGRVVVTSSGLQAYASFENFAGVLDSETGRTRKRFAMIDGSSFDHKKCYAASKLCNIAFCLELNRRLEKRQAVAICFTPGLIPTSGLFRHQKRWKETVLKKQAVGIDETEEWGGCLLAWMALSDEAGKQGGAYWRAPFGISKRGGKIPDDLYSAPINDAAKNPHNQEQLWNLSAELSGIPADFVPDR
jgi:NAD(P)-dependent dehydrogenase (short-subunit alcohol dehydrogenase family)